MVCHLVDMVCRLFAPGEFNDHQLAVQLAGYAYRAVIIDLRPQAWPMLQPWQRAASALHVLLSLPVLLRWHVSKGRAAGQWPQGRHLTIGSVRIMRNMVQVRLAKEAAATGAGLNPTRPYTGMAFNVRWHVPALAASSPG